MTNVNVNFKKNGMGPHDCVLEFTFYKRAGSFIK